MRQKEIIQHMKEGAELNIWLEQNVTYKGTLTIDNGTFPEIIATLNDKQIDSLLSKDFIVLSYTTYPEHRWFVQHFIYQEVTYASNANL